jgi:glycosyl hydrolase family 31
MYQDGWTLLDDSACALFDQATAKTTARTGRAQDGYVSGTARSTPVACRTCPLSPGRRNCCPVGLRPLATKFFDLREKFMPCTDSIAAEATRSGTPMVRPMYLAYPGEQDAYASASSQYRYGPCLLVVPAVTSGLSATTTVVPARQHVDGLFHRPHLSRWYERADHHHPRQR